MRLQAWNFGISDVAADDDENLSVLVQVRRHWASIRVGAFFDQDPDEQRTTVVHELIHVVQADMLDYFYPDPGSPHGGWRGPMAPDMISTIEAKVQLETERQADFLARLLAPLLPMPPEWP